MAQYNNERNYTMNTPIHRVFRRDFIISSRLGEKTKLKVYIEIHTYVLDEPERATKSTYMRYQNIFHTMKVLDFFGKTKNVHNCTQLASDCRDC